jgi:hypothetical protein
VTLAPPQPPPPPGVPRLVFDGSFIGPLVPPSATHPRAGAPAVPEAVLAIPLGTRQLVSRALDLMTRPDAGLRAASFYIGFIVLVTIAPIALLAGLAATLDPEHVPVSPPPDTTALAVAMLLASIVAIPGYVVATIESRALATAVIGGLAEGRPLRLRESIAVVRRRFWHLFGAMVAVGIVTGIVGAMIQLPIAFALGNVEAVNYGLSLVIGTLLAAPFVYVPAGVVIGEVDAFEAIRRSIRLARRRRVLAVVVALFGILSQLLVLFGVSTGGDVVVRVVQSTGLADAFPPALVVPLVAALTFAYGTLLFLVEAVAAAPAVYAFEALTRYTHGLETGRVNPLAGTAIWNPWMTRGLIAGSLIGLLAIAVGLVNLAALGL